MSLKELIQLFYTIIYLLNLIYISDGSYCNVPNHCVDFLECPLVVEQIKRVLTAEETNFIRKSKCNKPKRFICCPIDLPKPTDCGKYYSTWDRIYGGVTTSIEEFPWTVLLKEKGGNFLNHICGGSLINKRYIITAAHCLKKRISTNAIEDIEIESVLLGEWNKTTYSDCINGTCSDPTIEINVEKHIIHESYIPQANSSDDIALLRLDKEVDYTKYIQPICLPLSDKLKNNHFEEDTTFTVAGWGKTETTRQTSHIKKTAYLPSFNRNKCVNIYWDTFKTNIIEKQICAGGESNIDTCKGDSGGPLMALNHEDKYDPRYYLAGIVSFGTQPCGKSGLPGIYTRVGAYMDWILENIEP